jgi:serine/threonine-protein kinase
MPEEAHKILEKAISLYPDYAVFHQFLGELWMDENEFALGEASFRQGLSLATDNYRLYAQLAQALHRQGQTTEAIQVIQDGLKIKESGALYNNLGTYLAGQGHYELAVQAFESALEKGNSYNYLFWGNLGSLYGNIPSRTADANAAFDRAIQLLQVKIDEANGKNPVQHHRAAYYYAKRGHFDLAREALARVKFDGPMSAFELYRSGNIHELLGERDHAIEIFERAVKAGFPLQYILDEPDLAELRQDPAYHLMLTRLDVDEESE